MSESPNFFARYKLQAAGIMFVGLSVSVPAYIAANFDKLVVRDQTVREWVNQNGWGWTTVVKFALGWVVLCGLLSLGLYGLLTLVSRFIDRGKKAAALEIRFEDKSSFVGNHTGGRVYRVAVTSPVNAVCRLLVKEVTFENQETHPNLYLRITNDKTGRKNQTELHQGVPVYWDVVEKFSHGGSIQLRHTVENVPHYALGNRNQFQIIASSNSTLPASKWVSVQLEENGHVRFQLNDQRVSN